MRVYDLEIYSMLLKRPAMIMGTNNWNDVEQFIRAYRMGSKEECNFMCLLTNQINDKYGIDMPSNGLIPQIKLAAAKTEQNWEEFFVKEAKEVIINESDKNNENRMQKNFRNRVLKFIEEMPNLVDVNKFILLNHINREIEDWEGKNLSIEELKLIKDILENMSDEIFVHDNIYTKATPLSDVLNSKILRLQNLIKREQNIQ